VKLVLNPQLESHIPQRALETVDSLQKAIVAGTFSTPQTATPTTSSAVDSAPAQAAAAAPPDSSVPATAGAAH
jgi:hypothetical protein